MTEIVVIVVLIAINGFLAAAEIALVSAKRVRLKERAEGGSRGALRALELMDDPSRFLAAIQLGITLAGFMASAAAAVSLATVLAGWLQDAGVSWSDSATSALSVILVTIAIAYVTLVFGELVPKRLGLFRAESVAAGVARPVSWFATITHPLTWALAKSTDAVARIVGVSSSSRRADVTEEEIRLLVAEQAGLLEEEKRMIEEVFDLGDTVVREIMVPRVDMVMLEDTADVTEALATFRSSGFSRLPVYREEPDDIAGILLLKDVLPLLVDGAGAEPVVDHVREATFVPESKSALALLSEMQAARQHMVIVVGEYGGTEGLVTIEDIVEEVIGEITDEFDREERYVTELGEDDWAVDGRISVEDASEALGVAFPESEDYETLAGWVLAELGHIPTPGESVELDGVSVRVQAVRRRRISRLRVTRRRDAEQSEES
jgi:putative hemolysin